MVHLIKEYISGIDLLYLKSDKKYVVNKTIDLGDVIVDIDENKRLVSAEILQASYILNVSKEILKDDFEIQIVFKSERSNIIIDLTFTFKIDNEHVIRHVHNKLNNPNLSIPLQDLVLEKA